MGSAQVQAEHGVGRVRVGRLHGLVLRRIDARDVADLIPGCFEFGVRAIHEVGVLDAVAIHDGVTVDKSLLGDGAGFVVADIGLGVCGQNSLAYDEQRGDKASQNHGDSLCNLSFPGEAREIGFGPSSGQLELIRADRYGRVKRERARIIDDRSRCRGEGQGTARR